MSVATRSYIKNAIERLYGIIGGISINYHINDQEIIAMKNWIDTHELMHNLEPFKGLNTILMDILDDGVIDEDERKELLEWCSEILNDHGFLDGYTQIIRRLHGIFSGIMCDSVIKPNELEGLKDWLFDYEDLHGWWPINQLISLINDVLKDGKVDDKEHSTLQQFFTDFEEQVIENPQIHDDEYWLNRHMISPRPVFKPIDSICESCPEIIFNYKKFCLTGPAATGKRKDLFGVIESLGGIPCKNPIMDLDFLIIGAQSSPAWIYSTYGRKIESVMQRKKMNTDCQTQIIKEYDFIQAVKKMGGENIIPDPNQPLF